MNKNLRIRVKTSVGLTQLEETGSNIGQGRVEGMTVSAVSLDTGIKKIFHDKEEEKEDNENLELSAEDNPVVNDKEEEKGGKVKGESDSVNYHDIKIYPLILQDDVANAAKKRNGVQNANDKMEVVLEEKLRF